MHLTKSDQYSIVLVIVVLIIFSIFYFYIGKYVYDALLYNAEKQYGIIKV